jgi:RecB family exonuclease
VACHPLYAQPFAVEPPGPPRHWSYSSLALWRDCPRRWWLENSKYAGDQHRYPRRVHPAAVEGTVVHQVLDRFAGLLRDKAREGAEYADVRAMFPLRRELLAALDSYCAKNLEGNPRVDVQRIRARIDLDACSNAFRTAAPSLWESLRAVDAARACRSISKEWGDNERAGTEMWLQAESPRIAGQADVIARGVLIDYKTGAQRETHWQQLRFYALLHWLVFKKRARILRLIYTGSRETLDQDAPTEAELSADAERFSAEIHVIDGVLTAGSVPPARPALERCSTCHVRQLCSDYWGALPIWIEASAFARGDATIGESNWGDVEVRFASPVSPTAGYDGPASADPWGDVTLRVGVGKCPARTQEEGARLLGARIAVTGGRVEVTASRDSEVFWLPAGEPHGGAYRAVPGVRPQ